MSIETPERTLLAGLPAEALAKAGGEEGIRTLDTS